MIIRGMKRAEKDWIYTALYGVNTGTDIIREVEDQASQNMIDKFLKL